MRRKADNSDRRAFARKRLRWAALLVVVATGLIGCGESAEEEALAEVCDARAEIEQEVDGLQSLTLSTVSIDRVRDALDAIEADLQNITDATGDLAEDTRTEVEEATDDFRSSVDDALSSLGETTTLQAGRTQVSAAIDDLARSYEDAFAPVECD
jgi:hypothetical protein